MAQALIKGLIHSKLISNDKIFASNRTPGKLIKLKENFQIQTKELNEEIVEICDIVVLAMKPQDLPAAISSLASQFNENQIVISLAAGISFNVLNKLIPIGRVVRLMPNTPSLIGKGLIGVISARKDEALMDIIKSISSGLGKVIEVENEDQFDSLMIACSSGTGFLFELMLYWQDWITERGFSPEIAKDMTIETFLGAAMLASESKHIDLEELQQRVTSKKGVTFAGLNSMRELEIERTLRISFEKAAMRAKEINRQTLV